MEIMSVNIAKPQINGSEKTVFITGVTGQDGSLMADYLLENTSYNIIGGARRLSVENHKNINHLINNKRFHLINFDLTDTHSIESLVLQLQPNYFLNLAAQTFVKSSWDFPIQTWNTNTDSVLHILEAIRNHCPECRFYNAGSSEEFGNIQYSPQDEKHPLCPRSPYAASKAAARQLVKVYRESYNLFAIQGWLFNHEGVRRGKEFVTRKITSKLAEIYLSLQKGSCTPLELGNLDAKRDWSDAEDMVRAIWAMVNNDEPKEYVVASNTTYSIREFLQVAFDYLKIDIRWEGTGMDEKCYYVSGLKNDVPENTVLVQINSAFFRPAEVDYLLGDITRIKAELGWEPKTDFHGLVTKMMHHDLQLLGVNF